MSESLGRHGLEPSETHHSSGTGEFAWRRGGSLDRSSSAGDTRGEYALHPYGRCKVRREDRARGEGQALGRRGPPPRLDLGRLGHMVGIGAGRRS
jgi:hypothetical protein